jgi:hypothetical protein
VSCLLFSWKDEDLRLPIFAQIVDLMHVLRVMYKYSVEEYRTPLSDGFLSVVRKVFEFLRDVQSLELEDSYYAGHARSSSNGLSEWW